MLCCAALIIVSITRYRLSRRSILIGCVLCACACKLRTRKNETFFIRLFKGFCNFLTVLIFGIYADAIPGKWMPRADYTFLSWSYLFTLGSMVSSLFAVGFSLFEIYFITEAKKYNNEKTFIRHVGNPNQPFVRHGDKDEPPFVRKASQGEEPFIRKTDDDGDRAFIRRADNDKPDEAFIRRADGSMPEEAFIRRADGAPEREEPFIRRANGKTNQGNSYVT